MNKITSIPDFSVPAAGADHIWLDALNEARIYERTRRVVACQRLTSSAIASLTDSISELSSAIASGGKFDPAADYHDSVLGMRNRLQAATDRLSALLGASDVVHPGRAA